jgi:hypothetical protein
VPVGKSVTFVQRNPFRNVHIAVRSIAISAIDPELSFLVIAGARETRVARRSPPFVLASDT